MIRLSFYAHQKIAKDFMIIKTYNFKALPTKTKMLEIFRMLFVPIIISDNNNSKPRQPILKTTSLFSSLDPLTIKKINAGVLATRVPEIQGIKANR